MMELSLEIFQTLVLALIFIWLCGGDNNAAD